MNKNRRLQENMLRNISKSLKSILNEGTYVMTPKDEDYLKQAFVKNPDQPQVCDFLTADGVPVVLDSEYGDENLSINSIDSTLKVLLSDGETAYLRDVINDSDDVETLHDLIVDYADIQEENGYIMTSEDEDYLKHAFEENGHVTQCDFMRVDGEPVVLNSVYGDDNLSIDIVYNDLTAKLTSGETVNLKDVITEDDDIEILYDLIVDFSELTESQKIFLKKKLPPFTKENYPHLWPPINEASQKDKLQHASQFASRVKTIADRIERDCKDYDEKWALGYADQLRNAAEKMLKVLK